MSDFSLKMTGDWNRAGVHLQSIAVKLRPMFEGQLYEDGELILEKMRGHIDAQDLNWTPLAKRTVELKGGDTTIYIETGKLREGLCVRRIKSSVKGSTIFVGASPWKKHGEVKMSDLMIWLEYGTDKIPPRPLVQPTLEEVKKILQDNWKDLLDELIRKG